VKVSKNRVGENGSVETGVLKRLEHTILTYFKIRFVDQVRKETQLFSPIPPILQPPPPPLEKRKEKVLPTSPSLNETMPWEGPFGCLLVQSYFL